MRLLKRDSNLSANNTSPSSNPSPPPSARGTGSAATSPRAAASASPQQELGTSPPSQVPAMNMQQLTFNLKQVNAHTVFNKWYTVDESNHFSLQTKEKKAITTAQCRIIVKGAKHFPLQVASAPTIEELFMTWQYCRQIEDVIPKAFEYKEVEQWVKQHVGELLEAERGLLEEEEEDGVGRMMSDSDDTDDDTEPMISPQRRTSRGHVMVHGMVAEPQGSGDGAAAGSPPAMQLETPDTSPEMGPFTGDAGPPSTEWPAFSSILSVGAVVEKTLSFRETMQLLKSSMFLAARRPTTKEEWQKRHEVIGLARRNRTIAVMSFFFIYSLLLRFMAFDGFLLLQFFLQIFLFYVTTFYREIAVHFARNAAKKRVNRVKDWFYFGLRGNSQRTGAAAEPAPPPEEFE